MGDNIRVAIRIRPQIEREKDAPLCWNRIDNIITSQNVLKKSSESFMFDTVLGDEATNETVFQKVVKSIVDDSLNGYNGTVFAYGQTASGKTYTMLGNEDNLGVIPLAVEYIFNFIENTPGRTYLIRVSFIEIYKENITDLLAKKQSSLKIVEDKDGMPYIGDVTEVVVTSAAALMKCLRDGEQRRQFGETSMNERSSRSHTIFKMVIESHSSGAFAAHEDEEAVAISHLNLVDLAGSEKSGQMNSKGTVFKEGCSINLSLLALSQVISKLSEGNSQFINFRDSNLTRILKPSLGGNSKTAIICNITPFVHDESLSTLKFADRARAIKNKPKINAILSQNSLLKKYEKDILTLQAELQRESESQRCQILQKELEERDSRIFELQEKLRDMNEKLLVSSHKFVLPSSKPHNRRETWCGLSSHHKSKPRLRDSMQSIMSTIKIDSFSIDDSLMTEEFHDCTGVFLNSFTEVDNNSRDVAVQTELSEEPRENLQAETEEVEEPVQDSNQTIWHNAVEANRKNQQAIGELEEKLKETNKVYEEQIANILEGRKQLIEEASLKGEQFEKEKAALLKDMENIRSEKEDLAKVTEARVAGLTSELLKCQAELLQVTEENSREKDDILLEVNALKQSLNGFEELRELYNQQIESNEKLTNDMVIMKEQLTKEMLRNSESVVCDQEIESEVELLLNDVTEVVILKEEVSKVNEEKLLLENQFEKMRQEYADAIVTIQNMQKEAEDQKKNSENVIRDQEIESVVESLLNDVTEVVTSKEEVSKVNEEKLLLENQFEKLQQEYADAIVTIQNMQKEAEDQKKNSESVVRDQVVESLLNDVTDVVILQEEVSRLIEEKLLLENRFEYKHKEHAEAIATIQIMQKEADEQKKNFKSLASELEIETEVDLLLKEVIEVVTSKEEVSGLMEEKLLFETQFDMIKQEYLEAITTIQNGREEAEGQRKDFETQLLKLQIVSEEHCNRVEKLMTEKEVISQELECLQKEQIENEELQQKQGLKIAELLETETNLKNELATLKNTLSTLTQECENNHKHCTTTVLEDLEFKKQLEAEVSRLLEDQLNLNAHINLLEESKTALSVENEENLDKMKKMKEDYENEIATRLQELQKLELHASSLEDKNCELMKETRMVAEARALNQDYENRLSDLQVICDETSKRYEMLVSEKEILLKELNECQNEITKAVELRQNYEEQCADYLAKETLQKTEFTALDNKMASLQVNYDKLQKSKRDDDDQATNLAEQIQLRIHSLEEENTVLKTGSEDFNKTRLLVQDYKIQIRTLTDNLMQLKDQITSLENQKLRLSAESLANLKAADTLKENYDAQISEFLDDQIKLEEQLKSMEDQNSKLKIELHCQLENLKKKEMEFTTIEEEKTKLLSDIRALKKEMTATNDKYEKDLQSATEGITLKYEEEKNLLQEDQVKLREGLQLLKKQIIKEKDDFEEQIEAARKIVTESEELKENYEKQIFELLEDQIKIKENSEVLKREHLKEKERLMEEIVDLRGKNACQVNVVKQSFKNQIQELYKELEQSREEMQLLQTTTATEKADLLSEMKVISTRCTELELVKNRDDERIQKLVEKFDESQEQKLQLEQQFLKETTKLTTKIGTLERNYDDERQRLKKAYEEQSAALLVKFNEEVTKAGHDVISLSSDIANEKERCAKYEREFVSLTSQLQNCTEGLALMKAEVMAKNEQYVEQKRLQTEFEEEIIELKALVKRLQEGIAAERMNVAEEMNSTVEKHHLYRREVESTFTRMQKENAELRTDNEIYKQKLQEADSTATGKTDPQMEKENLRLQNRIKVLEKNEREVEDIFHEMREQLNQQCDELQENYERECANHTKTKTELETMKKLGNSKCSCSENCPPSSLTAGSKLRTPLMSVNRQTQSGILQDRSMNMLDPSILLEKQKLAFHTELDNLQKEHELQTKNLTEELLKTRCELNELNMEKKKHEAPLRQQIERLVKDRNYHEELATQRMREIRRLQHQALLNTSTVTFNQPSTPSQRTTLAKDLDVFNRDMVDFLKTDRLEHEIAELKLANSKLQMELKEKNAKY